MLVMEHVGTNKVKLRNFVYYYYNFTIPAYRQHQQRNIQTYIHPRKHSTDTKYILKIT